MPCRSDEEDMQLHAVPDPIMPSTPPCNVGAGHAGSDNDGVSTENDEESIEKKKKLTTQYINTYETVKRCVTGERAEQPEEDIERKLLEEVCGLMHLSGLRSTPLCSHNTKGQTLQLWQGSPNTALRGKTLLDGR